MRSIKLLLIIIIIATVNSCVFAQVNADIMDEDVDKALEKLEE